MRASHGEGWRGRNGEVELRRDWQVWHRRFSDNRGGIADGADLQLLGSSR